MANWFQRKQIGKQRDRERRREWIEKIDTNNYVKIYNKRNGKTSRKRGRKHSSKFKCDLRRGSMVITDTFILVVSLLIITVTTIFMVNILTPFIYYQKLQMTAQKYMYIIEKYGGLTNLEVSQMYKELELQGFQRDKIKISVPDNLASYGEEIMFEVKYTHNQKVPSLDGGIVIKDKDIDLIVRKVSIAKK